MNCVYLINTALPCTCMEHVVFFRITVRVLLTSPCPGVTVSPTEIPRGVGNRCTVIQWHSPILSPAAARQYTGARLTRSLCILGTSLKSKQCRPQGNQTLSQDKDDGNMLGGGRGQWFYGQRPWGTGAIKLVTTGTEMVQSARAF